MKEKTPLWHFRLFYHKFYETSIVLEKVYCAAVKNAIHIYILLKKLIEITWTFAVTDDDSLKKRYNEVW